MSAVSYTESLRQNKEHKKTVSNFDHNQIEDMHTPKANHTHQPSEKQHNPNISPLHFNKQVDLSGNVINNGIRTSDVKHDRRMKHNPIDNMLPNDHVHGNHIIYGGGFIIDKSKIL